MLGSLSTAHLLAVAAVMTAAYSVRGMAGFGSGLIAIPLLAQFEPLTVVVPVIGRLDYLASLTHSTRHRRSAQWWTVKNGAARLLIARWPPRRCHGSMRGDS